MTLIENLSEDDDPLWDNFGISRCDFRPHFDGDLVNVYTTINPLDSCDETEATFKSCALQIIEWILESRSDFGDQDRFQVIVGWPKTFRETGRQVLKTGGTYAELRDILDGNIQFRMMPNWSSGLFK